MTNNEFVQMFGNIGVAHYKTEKILPSMIIAQAILESGWGQKSELATKYNNYFGLKWYATDTVCNNYKSVVYGTWEEYKQGVITNVDSLFCSFISIEQCMECLYRWYNRPKYLSLHGVKDYKESCNIVRKCGYATDYQYTTKLIKLIEDNNLTEWDKKGFNSIDESLYRVQCGVFQVIENAKKLATNLKKDGYDVCLKKVLINGVIMYRVQTGAFIGRNNAVKLSDNLKLKGYQVFITTESGEDVTL